MNNLSHLDALAPQPRVLIVDDDALVRQFLTQILNSDNIEVVAHAQDGDEVVDLVHAHRPDVILMDIRMQRMSGIDATKAVKALANPPGIIALTSFDSEPAILDCVAAGVNGFLAKDFAPAEIIAAVRAVARGEGALSPRAAKVLVSQTQKSQHIAGAHQARALMSKLSARELSVAELNALGSSNSDIATTLFVSEATVKTHMASAMTKMNVTNRVQLAVALTTAKLGSN